MDVVLVHPEIPHNTGCAARLTAATGHCLHLVEPLGFSLEDRYLKRAGLDYWPQVELVLHRDWERAAEVLASSSSRPLGERLRLFTARGGARCSIRPSSPTTCSSSGPNPPGSRRSCCRPTPRDASTFPFERGCVA